MPHRSDRHEQEAIFWCSLLQPLICGEIGDENAQPTGGKRQLSLLCHITTDFPDERRSSEPAQVAPTQAAKRPLPTRASHIERGHLGVLPGEVRRPPGVA